MTYQETLSYLYQQLPMFQRIGSAAFKKDLTNTLKLAEKLGNPHQKFKSIHVAGTNGKGSVCHMLTSVLMQAGYKIGLYTSPHLTDFRERIKINGQMITESEVIAFVEKMKHAIEEIQPSFFELTVVMAFDHFASHKTDIAIIETGMGGRLDSTNIIRPELSIITNVGLDHQHMLGDTLDKIAFEKAGIIKEEVPVVIGRSNPLTDQVFQQKAEISHAPIYFADQENKYEIQEDKDFLVLKVISTNDNQVLKTDLKGAYQPENIITTWQSLKVLNPTGIKINNDAIQKGLMNVKANTGFAGRMEKLGERPLILADVAHNAEGLTFLLKSIDLKDFEKIHIVYGMVNDKYPSEVLPLLPQQAKYYFCKADIPRGLESEKLSEIAKGYNLKGDSFGSVEEAVKGAKINAQPNDLILITGSAFVVADALMWFQPGY